MNLDGALEDLASIGPYFAVSRVPAGEDVVRLRQLYDGGPELTSLVEATTEALGSTETRVGASISFQGLAARLWSPVIGLALRNRIVLDLDPATTAYDQAPGGRLHQPDPVAGPAGDPDHELAGAVYDAVVRRHLEPLAGQLGQVSAQVLWGNAASALIGSYGVLVSARHELADDRLPRAILRIGRLDGTGRLDARGFRRNSCCLYYRVPNGGLCGDCVLTMRPSGRTTR